MRARPIIMGAESVRAILAGIKVETRRVVTVQPWAGLAFAGRWEIDGEAQYTPSGGVPLYLFQDEAGQRYRWRCPYGEPGDRLWVGETYYPTGQYDVDGDGREAEYVYYRASEPEAQDDPELGGFRWRPALYMPRRYSRLTLAVVSIRAERLWEIADKPADVLAEGYKTCHYRGETTARVDDPEDFTDAWDHLNARRGFAWATNPWVWVVAFRPLPERPVIEERLA